MPPYVEVLAHEVQTYYSFFGAFLEVNCVLLFGILLLKKPKEAPVLEDGAVQDADREKIAVAFSPATETLQVRLIASHPVEGVAAIAADYHEMMMVLPAFVMPKESDAQNDEVVASVLIVQP
jgi:hypothetical protein